jgi:hypothetical protein
VGAAETFEKVKVEPFPRSLAGIGQTMDGGVEGTQGGDELTKLIGNDKVFPSTAQRFERSSGDNSLETEQHTVYPHQRFIPELILFFLLSLTLLSLIGSRVRRSNSIPQISLSLCRLQCRT